MIKVTAIDVARNKRHAPCLPSDVRNGQFEFGGDTIFANLKISGQTSSRL